jgi:hypothetical protein
VERDDRWRSPADEPRKKCQPILEKKDPLYVALKSERSTRDWVEHLDWQSNPE